MPHRQPARAVEMPLGTLPDWSHHALRSMVSQINHQMRNPVGLAQNAVGRISLLVDELKGAPGPERVAAIHAKIDELATKAADALTRTLHESEPLRQGVQGPALDTPAQDFSISQVLVSLCRYIDPAHVVDVECKAFPDYVATHVGRLDQIFAPLIMNACDRMHTAGGGRLKILISGSDSLCVDITDPAGANTAAEMRELIRWDGVRDGRRGLATCSDILRSLGGTMSVQDDLQHGVTCRLVFPPARKPLVR